MPRSLNYLQGLMRLRKFSPDISELIIFITNACNLNCGHCFYSAELRKPTETIKIEDYEKMIKSLQRPLLNVILTGGEPFLEPKIPAIVKILNDINKTKQITIPSNGRTVDLIVEKTKEILSIFRGHVHVQISLDGLSQYHNKLRGDEKSFASAVLTVQRLRELVKTKNNFTVGVNTTVSRENLSELEELAKFVNQELAVPQNFELIRGVNYLDNKVINAGILSDFKPKEENILVPSDQELADLNKKLDKILFLNTKYVKDVSVLLKPFFYATKSTQEFYFSKKMLFEKKPLKFCKAGRSMAVIYPNGDLAFCELTKIIVNLRAYDFDLYKLWNDETIKNKSKMLKCYCTHGCFVPQTFPYFSDMRLRFIKQVFKYLYFKFKNLK